MTLTFVTARLRLIVAVAAVLLLAAACSSDSTTDDVADSAVTTTVSQASDSSQASDTTTETGGSGEVEVLNIDVCELLTPEEIEAGLGEGASPVAVTVSPGYDDCSLQNGEQDGATITVVSLEGFTTLDDLNAEVWVFIDGLGDRAAERIDEGYYAVRVQQGPYKVEVVVQGFDDMDETTRRELGQQLAEAVASRLP